MITKLHPLCQTSRSTRRAVGEAAAFRMRSGNPSSALASRSAPPVASPRRRRTASLRRGSTNSGIGSASEHLDAGPAERLPATGGIDVDAVYPRREGQEAGAIEARLGGVSDAVNVRAAPPGPSTRTCTPASLTGSKAGVTTRTVMGTAVPSGGGSISTDTGAAPAPRPTEAPVARSLVRHVAGHQAHAPPPGSLAREQQRAASPGSLNGHQGLCFTPRPRDQGQHFGARARATDSGRGCQRWQRVPRRRGDIRSLGQLHHRMLLS